MKLVDGEGRPVASAPVGLRIAGLLLDANALRAAGSRGGSAFAMTGSSGELTLGAVDPRTPGGVELIVGRSEVAVAFDLSGFEPGEEVVIVANEYRVRTGVRRSWSRVFACTSI